MKDSIWLHAVSVGEVKAVERLLEGLRQQFPEKSLVVSTVTPAGQALDNRARRDFLEELIEIDLEYVRTRSLRRDLVIVAQTLLLPLALLWAHLRSSTHRFLGWWLMAASSGALAVVFFLASTRLS